jgi:hypothetical protein
MNKVNSNFDGQTIFVGMDVYKSCWNLGIHLSDMFRKAPLQSPALKMTVRGFAVYFCVDRCRRKVAPYENPFEKSSYQT